ncbi:low molecular weight protein-tyrosine-phosphatase [Chitinilyticum aquatile]|uniref:low molecular weight protein-tyrosine-phosphatase n=1 Tax=Chitinilyticum aquatile TaxID=362520 RepID=UPI00041AB375|nr:low molecular weight protein-tyrosine-phosphatase [Chitinilyticum aquatile]
MSKQGKFSVLFVCTGNICRSPTADGVMRHLVRDAGLEHCIEVDSAGTYDYHVGEAPDRRAQQHARKRGYDLSFLRAREVSHADFARFDLILAMDNSHMAVLQRRCPADQQHRLRMFMDFAGMEHEREVPDPYYGGADGFEQVLDMVEAACNGILEHARTMLTARCEG